MKIPEKLYILDHENSNKITFLSFVMSIIIICYHLDSYGSFYNIYNDSGIIDTISLNLNQKFNMLGSIAVSYFFMTSGFLLYYNLDKNNIKKKLLNRLTTLLIPYILWNLIGFLFYEHSSEAGLGHILLKFILSEYCGQLWFVRELFIMLALIPLLIVILDKRIFGAYFVIISFFVSYGITSYLSPYVTTNTYAAIFERIFRYIPIYFTGAYFGRNYFKEINNETYQSIKCKMICFALLMFSFLNISSPIMWYLQRLQPILLWAVLNKSNFKFKLPWYMQISFYIYAIHVFVIDCYKIIGRYKGIFAWGMSISTALLIRVIITILTFLCAVISAFILIKFSPKIYMLLSGGRIPKINPRKNNTK